MLTPDSTQKRTPGFDGKRLHLLKTAARVFSEVGYDEASMRRIAGETEFSLAGIYHYVAGKEELLYWIQYDTFDSLLQDLASSLEGVEDPRERLEAAVRNHVRHFGENMYELKVCARELETLEGEAIRMRCTSGGVRTSRHVHHSSRRWRRSRAPASTRGSRPPTCSG